MAASRVRSIHTQQATRLLLTVAEYIWKSPIKRWCASHLRRNLELRTLLIKVRLWFKRQTWMSPSWSSLNLGPPPELVLCGRGGHRQFVSPFTTANAMVEP